MFADAKSPAGQRLAEPFSFMLTLMLLNLAKTGLFAIFIYAEAGIQETAMTINDR